MEHRELVISSAMIAYKKKKWGSCASGCVLLIVKIAACLTTKWWSHKEMKKWCMSGGDMEKWWVFTVAWEWHDWSSETFVIIRIRSLSSRLDISHWSRLWPTIILKTLLASISETKQKLKVYWIRRWKMIDLFHI